MASWNSNKHFRLCSSCGTVALHNWMISVKAPQKPVLCPDAYLTHASVKPVSYLQPKRTKVLRNDARKIRKGRPTEWPLGRIVASPAEG